MYVCLRLIMPAWYEAELGGEDLPAYRTFIFLAENDSVVQVQTIRRALFPLVQDGTVKLWYERDEPHGAFLLNPALCDKLIGEIVSLSKTPVGLLKGPVGGGAP